MRVLHLNKRYPPHIGGIEKHLQDLARTQAATPGFEVDVAVVSEHEPGLGRDGSVTLHRGRQIAAFASNPLSLDMASILRASDHDVWHFHYPFPTGELSLLLSGRPPATRPAVVCTYHSDFVAQSITKRMLSAPYAALTRRFLDAVDAVVVSSPGLAAGSQFLRAVSDKIRVIPFGIDTDWLIPHSGTLTAARTARERLGSPLTLFVGRLVPYKGVDVLLEAFRRVPGTLVLVGDGPLRSRLQAVAEHGDLAGRVHFAGGLSEAGLAAMFHAADVFVLPSVTANEAFGLVQLEAHACGVPVVSTDLPTGVPFANSHGETGLVVPPGDPVELAAALRLLLEDEELRRRMGTRARERQRAEFSLEIMTARVLALYEELTAALDR